MMQHPIKQSEIELKDISIDTGKEELPISKKSLESAEKLLDKGYDYYAKQIKSILPDLPPVDISLKGVNYTASIPKEESTHEVINIVSGFYHQLRRIIPIGLYTKKTILHNITFRFKPGTSTLVMGPPSCGSSTVLKMIAGLLPKSDLSGSVTCNGKSLDNFNWKRYSSFCGQLDVHLPLLSVKDTFDFAVACLNGKGEMRSKGHSMMEDDINLRTDLFLTLLGLKNCENTIVGDAVHRGCSGGEAKRVSVGESLLGPSRVLLLDKISTGLDSAVTFDICKFLNQWTKIFEGILVCHLLQPDPEVIALFDNMIILSEGHVTYAGPCDGILPYFNSIGYQMIEGKDLGAFICEIGKEETREDYRKDATIPLTTQYLVDSYEKSELKSKNLEIVNEKVENTEVPKNDYNDAMFTNSHPMGFWHEFIYLLRRQVTVTLQDKVFIRGRIIQQIVMGILFGTVYFQIDKDNFIARTGSIVASVMALVNTSLALVVGIFRQKPVLYKQVQRGFFSVPSYVLSVVVNQIPLQLFEVLIFGSLLYFMSGYSLTENGAHYFIFLAYELLGYMAFTSFQLIMMYLYGKLAVLSAFLPIVGFFLNAFNGFNITKTTIPKWLIEFYYFSPLSYMIKGIAINEFTSSRYTPEESYNYLKVFDFPTDKNEQWQYFLILICEIIVFILLQMVVLHYVMYDPFPPSETVDIKDVKAVDEVRQSEMSTRSSRSEINFNVVDFSFEHVKYTVTLKDPATKKKVDKVLLNDVSGYVRSHSITALMGASGAGKTTLLDVLANRKTQGKIEGKFLLNGKEYKAKDLCMISGYVEQQDTLPETETVKEALMFSARLRYPDHPSDITIKRFVKEVIELLELKDYRNMMIGNVDDGLPMGVRKLVMVGIELVADPSILFLDEPTTGLDSSAALLVVQVLQRIAASGRSIICTIHQPSFEIFKLFTDVLLLERGGKVVYFGPLGENGIKVVEYMESIDGVTPIEKDHNPASWMLDVTGAGTGNTKHVKFGDHYLTTDLYRNVENTLENIKAANSKGKTIHFVEAFSSSIARQIYEVTKRNFRFSWRLLEFNLARYRVSLFMSLAMGVLYFQTPMKTTGNLQSRFACLSVYVMTIFMNNMISIVPVLMDRRLVFYREDTMRTYHPIAQLIGLISAEVVFSFFLAWCYMLFYYPMAGLRSEASRVFKHFFANYTFIILSVLLGQFFSYFFSIVQIATVCIICGLTLCSTSAGFTIPYPSLKAPWKWIYWINPVAFGLQSVVGNQFECDSYPVNTTNCPSIIVLGKLTTIHDYYASTYGIKYDYFWRYIGYMWIEIAVAVCLLFFGISKIRYLDR